MQGTEKQKLAMVHLTDTIHKVVVYGGAAGGGKSFLGCFWLIIMCKAYPQTRWFIGREELKRIRQSTLITFQKVASLVKVNDDYTTNFQDNYIQFSNGSRIDLLDLQYQPRDPLYERFGSTEYTGGWIEEGGETDFGAYDVLKTRIGRHMNDVYGLISKILITCNPKKNWLYGEIYKPFKEGTLDKHISFIQSLVTDNPHLTDDYIENLRNTKDKAKKERLLFGNWEYADDPTALCSYDNIISIFENDHIKPGAKYITADIARLGSDKAIIMVWSGWNVIDIVTYEISRMTEIQSKINDLRKKYGIPKHNCIADEDGVGGGVVDNCGIKGFLNNSKALNNENYVNLQSQCGYKLADKINNTELWISADVSEKDREQIIEDLEQLKTYQSDKDTKLRILPKEKIKDNIGRSPDWRDVLLMRVYFDLKKNYTLGVAESVY